MSTEGNDAANAKHVLRLPMLYDKFRSTCRYFSYSLTSLRPDLLSQSLQEGIDLVYYKNVFMRNSYVSANTFAVHCF